MSKILNEMSRTFNGVPGIRNEIFMFGIFNEMSVIFNTSRVFNEMSEIS